MKYKCNKCGCDVYELLEEEQSCSDATKKNYWLECDNCFNTQWHLHSVHGELEDN